MLARRVFSPSALAPATPPTHPPRRAIYGRRRRRARLHRRAHLHRRDWLFRLAAAAIWATLALGGPPAAAEEPPALNPFGPKVDAAREEAVGVLELSDGARREGALYLTRGMTLKILGPDKLTREIPLTKVLRIECQVKKEWQEREWRFKENASDEKVYTGRSYPAREYEHVVTLRDGTTYTGPMSAIVYVRGEAASDNPAPEAERFLLHKRDKGPIGATAASLVYVKKIELRKP